MIGDKLKTVSIFKITGRNWAVQSALNSQWMENWRDSRKPYAVDILTQIKCKV